MQYMMYSMSLGFMLLNGIKYMYSFLNGYTPFRVMQRNNSREHIMYAISFDGSLMLLYNRS